MAGQGAPGKCQAAPGQKKNLPLHVQRNLQYLKPCRFWKVWDLASITGTRADTVHKHSICSLAWAPRATYGAERSCALLLLGRN